MAGAAFPAVVVVFSLLGAAIFLARSASASWHAQVFVVGGEPRGWRKPTAPNEESYNHWASRNRFHVGDSLHFKYEKNDSVLVVTRDAYQLCATDKPTLRFDGGDTRFRLDHGGFCYFISGAPDHCDAGQRMTLRAMAPQQQDGGGGKPAAPARAPAAMSPGGEDDEGGTFEPPGARSSTPGSGGDGSGGSASRPPPHVPAGADGNKTGAAGSMHGHDASSSPPSLSIRGHRVLGVVALAALLQQLLRHAWYYIW